jgi:pilus assembly protein CpaB
MNSISMRAIATLAAAIFLGLLAVVLTRSYLSNAVRTNPAVATSTGPAIPVVVAAANVPRGGVLQAAMLKVVAYPMDAAPAGAFHAVADLTGGAGQQRLALRSMVVNEPILPGNISGPGGKLNLSGSVSPGMRAVSLRSNDVAGVGGFVLPGDRVDILLTRAGGSGGDTSKETLTQILAENARVLGVDQSDNDEADKPVVAKAVTVEVTPEQAASISLGQQIGTVSLTLRRVADDTPLASKAMTVADLGPAPKRSAAQAAPTIRVIRGTEATRFSLGVGGALQKAGEQMPKAVKTP